MADAYITREAIDTICVMAKVQSSAFGALVTFAGTVRDNSLGKRVVGIEYTAYEPLALSELRRIAHQTEQSRLCACAIAHRLGPVPIGQASVFIAVASAHRQEAFEACRSAIETIKTSVPIWKRESYDDGDIWIEGEQTYPVRVAE